MKTIYTIHDTYLSVSQSVKKEKKKASTKDLIRKMSQLKFISSQISYQNFNNFLILILFFYHTHSLSLCNKHHNDVKKRKQFSKMNFFFLHKLIKLQCYLY